MATIGPSTLPYLYGGVSVWAHRHVQVAADGADHDFSGIEPDADSHADPVGSEHALRVPLRGLLHPKRRLGRSDGMILLSEGGSKESH
jgi:hypothetical protein